MALEKQELITELTWQDVRGQVATVCSELASIIDDIAPSKEYKIYKVLYPFGAKIFDKNRFYLPHESPINNSLEYSALPLGIIVKNSAEAFFDINRKIFSLAVFGSGLDLGVWEHYGWHSDYSIVSGARSLYMLPKISETLSHKQLKKKFGIISAPPKHLYDHWHIFCQLAASESFPIDWFCEVLFLSDKWIKSITKDAAWSKLALYISNRGLMQHSYSRTKTMLDIAWESFVRFLSSQELKFDPYVVDTLKHILYISGGVLPASAPATGEDLFGPLKNIQAIYEDARGYGVEYIATIMQPQYFNFNSPQKVYYSLQMPTLIESLPRTRKITSVIDILRELNDLFTYFLDNTNNLWLQTTTGNKLLKNIITNLQPNYYHGDMFAYGTLIKPSSKIPNNDPRFKYTPSGEKKKIFANNSSFLRGCVQVSTKASVLNENIESTNSA